MRFGPSIRRSMLGCKDLANKGEYVGASALYTVHMYMYIYIHVYTVYVYVYVYV